MDEKSKFIKRLSQKDKLRIDNAISLIIKGDTFDLDIKRLRGQTDMFRVRIGSFRIIYRLHKEFGIIIIKMTRRDDTTYNI